LEYSSKQTLLQLLQPRECTTHKVWIFRSHKGVATLFALHFIKTNIIPKEIGKTYNPLFLLRQTGDYDDWNLIEEEDVTAMIKPTERLIQTIKKLLEQ